MHTSHQSLSQIVATRWIEHAKSLGWTTEQATAMFKAAWYCGSGDGVATVIDAIAEHGLERGLEVLRLVNEADMAAGGLP
jgi:hypothetical protein